MRLVDSSRVRRKQQGSCHPPEPAGRQIPAGSPRGLSRERHRGSQRGLPVRRRMRGGAPSRVWHKQGRPDLATDIGTRTDSSASARRSSREESPAAPERRPLLPPFFWPNRRMGPRWKRMGRGTGLSMALLIGTGDQCLILTATRVGNGASCSVLDPPLYSPRYERGGVVDSSPIQIS